MRTSRAIRTLAVLASAGLIVGAFAAVPAQAKKKKKKPAVCSTFKPGANGEGKPTLVVTDTATEQAPALQKVTLPAEVTEGIVSHGEDVFNIQVDSAAKEAGLHILWEFQERRDYDLNVWHTDGSYAARSHGFQPILGINPTIDETQGNLGGHAGESTTASEKIVGLRTSDCGGWTVSAENFLGEGGDFEIKVWLGAIENDPQAPGAETP
jgi:hypothetical protein